MDQEKLKPCAACGKSKFRLIKDGSGIYIKCDHCWSSAEHGSKTTAKAIIEWNEANE
jgi:hypothetical protein